MPLVFVHGVANRMGDDYRAGVTTRDAMFRQFLLAGHRPVPGPSVRIRNPYWGDFGGRLAWNGASLPLEDFEALGSDDAPFLALHASALPEGRVDAANQAVLLVARRSLQDAVDLLWSASALVAGDEADALAALAVPARAYAVANPHPAWVTEVRNDDELVARLEREVAGFAGGAADTPEEPEDWEALGGFNPWQPVRRGVARLRGAVTNVVGQEAAERIRPAAIPSVANFLGDVFVYLRQQDGVARRIGDLVEGDLRAAAAEASPEDPLVVVAHSMGGNIAYDLLTSSAADVTVDLYVTVGTQVGFFEELKLFTSSRADMPGADPRRKVPRPPNIRRWINVFDYSDLLGFEVGSIVEGVDDFVYRTGSLFKAHSQYFLQPGFHERLAARVRGGPR
jgi:hypothetical protein